MKTHFVVIGILGVFCSIANSQSLAENDLYEKLTKPGASSVMALESVLKKADEFSAALLYVAAGVAFKEKRLADSGFLFYAAQLRARFDKECFPAKGTGGNSPFVLYSALSQQIGSAINPALMADPAAFSQSLSRLKAWTPKASQDYDPGYEFKERKTEREANEAVKDSRSQFIDRMTSLSTLLNDAEYFAAFRTMQAFNLNADDRRPTQEANDKAVETMKRIETEAGLKGFMSK